MTRAHRATLALALAACTPAAPRASEPVVAPPPSPDAPSVTEIGGALATTPCADVRALGGAARVSVVGGTRRASQKPLVLVSLAGGGAALLADVTDLERVPGRWAPPPAEPWGWRELTWWDAGGACRWRARVPEVSHWGLFADGDRVWLAWHSDRGSGLGLRELDADGRVHRELWLPRSVWALAIDGGVMTLVSLPGYPQPLRLWRIDRRGVRPLALQPARGDRVVHAALAPGPRGTMAVLFYERESSMQRPHPAVLSVLDADGAVVTSREVAPAFDRAVIGADADGWLLAGLTPTWPTREPPDPEIRVTAFDRALEPRWTTTVPPTRTQHTYQERWTWLTAITRRGDELTLAIGDQLADRYDWLPGRVVLAAADGTALRRETSRELTPGDDWQMALVLDGDVFAGRPITTDRMPNLWNGSLSLHPPPVPAIALLPPRPD